MRWQLASTFAFTAMSAACYGPNTVTCPNGVLCPKGEVCTGNTTGNLCGDETEVAQCAETEHALCARASDVDEDGRPDDGLCVDKLCAPCAPELFECRYQSWTLVPSPAAELADVWMEAPNKAYAVGGTKVFEYDGAQWSALGVLQGQSPQALISVWSGDGHVFAVGVDGHVYRDFVAFDAGRPNVGSPDLYGVWGSERELVVVGSAEVIGQFNGSDWNWSSGDPLSVFSSVYGAGDFVVAVGPNGHATRRVGTVWQALPSIETELLTGVWATGPDDVYAAGLSISDGHGVIYHYTGGPQWTSESLPQNTPALRAIWGNGTELYAVGDAGTIVMRTNGEWSLVHIPTLRVAAVSGSGTDVVAVGTDGSIWRRSF